MILVFIPEKKAMCKIKFILFIIVMCLRRSLYFFALAQWKSGEVAVAQEGLMYFTAFGFY